MIKTLLQVFFFCSLFSCTLIAQPQKYPKVMSVIQGRIVEPRWEENESRYYDWKGERVKDLTIPTGKYTVQFVYVDSTGKTINDEKFDKAGAFFKGLAVVQTPGDYNHEKPKKFAVLNERGEFIIPYTHTYIENMGGGFVKLMSGDSVRLLDSRKKEIASCVKCDFSLSSTGRNIYQMPHPYSKDPWVIKLYDLKGNMLIEKPGFRIGYLSNNIARKDHGYAYEMPYHIIDINGQGRLISVVSDRGKLVLDSVDNLIFNNGIACVSRGRKHGFVVDSMFNVIIPSSFGHDFYWPLFKHPQHAFMASRNDSVMVIDRKNRLLVKPMNANYLEYDHIKEQYDIRHNMNGNKWILTLNGDTVASPSRYSEYSDMRPVLSGAMVRCKPHHLKGYVSDKGETIIPCKYVQLVYSDPARFVFFTDKEAGYLDARGKKLFTVDSAISLSNFVNGYAIFGFKKPAYRYGAQRVIGADYAYSVVFKMIDSTGKVISAGDYDEISRMHNGYCRVRLGSDVFMVNARFQKILSKDGYLLFTYFYKGTALAYNPKTYKIGVVNEKLETLVPAIYDRIDTSEEEGARYGFSISDRSEHSGFSDYHNSYAKIENGTLEVEIKGKKTTVSLKK